MSLTMSQGDGVTVISVTTNPESKWPLLCQILGNLCYSPVCSVAQKLKGKLTETQTALGIVQMIVGVISIAVGAILESVHLYNDLMETKAPFWLGAVFLAIGIVCVLAAKFPSPCLVSLILGGLDIILIVLAVLQLCVTISFCVLTLKALCRKSGTAQEIELPLILQERS
ncbi:hypothetical protein IRJ41_004238 [Triplophysa rosa]|uniref:Uncharacterized protein n=1 Tax=Triplophysa rosa TaxID=992332 RepID=A0A9W8C3A9_TRIRA|nr:hypothetical protein IRJ41_004238 [Triplophysa rosa]